MVSGRGGDDAGPDLDPAWIVRVRTALVDWFAGAGRDLPWRVARDPYRVLVSEMMLVQTTVAAVVPYFGRFLARFPTVEALAGADEVDVMKAWEGLGYYRRARQLHSAARAIVRDHGGRFPDDFDAILALPGVGRYVAGAVLSFGFDRPAPIVEANTRRVLCRWLAWPLPPGTTRSQDRLWRAAGRLVPDRGANAFNQAFMELGALVCIPRRPLCLACPVAADCGARLAGLQDVLPVSAPKAPPTLAVEACALVVREGRLLIVRRGPGRLWDGFWEFPTVHVSGADPAGRSFSDLEPVGLAEGVRRLAGVRVEVGPAVRTLRFGVTRYKVELAAHPARGLDEGLVPGPGLVDAAWVRPAELDPYPAGVAMRRLAAWIADQGPGFAAGVSGGS